MAKANRSSSIAALALSLIFPAVVHAQAYVAAGAVASSISAADQETRVVPAIAAGYRFGPALAIEGAYLPYGDWTVNAAVDLRREYQLNAARLSLVSSLPVTNATALLGSVSAYRFSGRLRQFHTGITPSETDTSGSATAIGFGIGLSHVIARSVEVRGMLDFIPGKHNAFGTGANMKASRVAGAWMLYRF